MDENSVRCEALNRLNTPYPAGDSNKKVDPIAPMVAALSANRTDDTRNTLMSEETSRIAGRVILKRNAGKIVFATVRSLESDGTVIQLFLAPQYLEAEEIQGFKENVHLGDVLYVEGQPGYSQTNELSFFVSAWQMASKGLNSFPKAAPNPETGILEHQLNGATVHDQPVLHLLTSATHRDRMVARSSVIRELRHYFEDNGFLEVETPILSTHAGGASASRFTTHSAARHEDMHLRIAPELYLKRLVIGGLGNVFEIGKNFRNEGIDSTHSPEFTALEAYTLHSDYRDQARMVSEIVGRVWIDGPSPMSQAQHLSFFEAAQNALVSRGVDRSAFTPESSVESIQSLLDSLGVSYPTNRSAAQLMEHLFDELVVPELGDGAVFVYDYPTGTTPLAYANGDGTSQKWDLYIRGMEVGTAYTENTDPLIQEETLTEDQDFVHDVCYGMPPMGGMGIGVDRLVMIVTGATHINQVNHHPHSAV